MKVSYGPPAQRGVTQLMAVGAADLEDGVTDHAVKIGTAIAGGVWLLGLLAGSNTMKTAGLGAAVALLGVRYASRRKAVEVATPAPAGRFR